MNKKTTGCTGAQPGKELRTWIDKQLHYAVLDLADRGVVEGITVEAKAAWVFPFTLLIGKIRDNGRVAGFDWFICGDAPITHADSSVARAPREAAKHFALQWQLIAARQGEEGKELAKRAEALYELVEEEELWLQK